MCRRLSGIWGWLWLHLTGRTSQGGVSTIEWGTRTAIDTYRKLYNRVPDVVYDLDAVGKEPMIRLRAHRAVDAAGLAVEIARRLGEE